MSVLNEDGGAAADDGSDRQRCSCLPAFCFWWGASGSGSGGGGGAQAKRRRRRRPRLRLRLSSWLAWPWLRKSGKGDAGEGGGDGSSSEKGKSKKRRRKGGRRLLLLLTTSLQPKKALASIVAGDSAPLLSVPVPAKVSSYGDAKKQSNRRPRRPTVDDAASGSRQPQASATASTGWTTAPARSRPETTTSQAPSPRPTDGPAGGAGRTCWRAPSRRHSLHQPAGDCSSSCGGMWTAATTLGVIVLFGRVTAVVFLCSCLYGARFVRAWAAGAGAGTSAKHAQLSSGGVEGVSSSSRRFGDRDPVGVAAGDKVVVAEMCATEECKKKVVMAGLLDRPARHPRRALVGDHNFTRGRAVNDAI